ncbi:MAG: DNA-J related domain-containing protein [Spirochaetales bacterium]
MRSVHPVWSFEELLAYFETRAGEDVAETDLLRHFFADENVFADGLGLDLFERHFLLYRRLWLFDDELRQASGRRLWIRGIRSTLLEAPPRGRCDALDPETGLFCEASLPCGTHGGLAPDLPTMKSYYLDETQLEGMTSERLERLLDGFYRWCFDPAGIEAAFEQLGLAPGASAEAVQRAWKQLSKKNHPDRGGDVVAFQQLSAAYQLLKRLLEPKP